jgi:hypothetical protein
VTKKHVGYEISAGCRATGWPEIADGRLNPRKR